MPPFHTGGAVIYKGAEEKNRRAYKNARNTAPRIPPFKKQINEAKKKYLFIPVSYTHLPLPTKLEV